MLQSHTEFVERMKTEKIILSFAATLIGLIAAGVLFYAFQATKTIAPSKTKTVKIVSPTLTPIPSIFLTIESPKDEEVVNSKVLALSGKTSTNAVITVITASSEDVITPAANGNFSTTVNIGNGENVIEIISIAPNGESVTIKKTVTYSLEEF